jgi:hypothetical protein
LRNRADPNGPFRVRTFPNRPYLRAISPGLKPVETLG